MKYKTNIYFLNNEEKKIILRELLKHDREALKKIYNAYKIPYCNLKIKVIENGFSADTAKEELKGFYFVLENDELIYNDACVHLFNADYSAVWFSKYNKKYKVDILRRNNKFYIFEGEKAPIKKDDFLIKSDRIKNTEIRYARSWGNIVYSNRFELIGKNKRNDKQIILDCGTYKNNNNYDIIDKSGYFKYNLLENLKKKAEEIRKNKNLQEFQNMEKSEIIKKVNFSFNETMKKIFLICDLKNIEFMQKLYDSYKTKNLQYYIKLYNKIIKLDYKKIDDFKNDLNDFYFLNAEKIQHNVYVAIAAGNIWVNDLSNPEKIHLSEVKEKTIFINENKFIYNNIYFNLKGEKI